ncbi:MAG: hypothetical protein AAB867_03255 [Patescibacteria group bacterium]
MMFRRNLRTRQRLLDVLDYSAHRVGATPKLMRDAPRQTIARILVA